ncbi:imidazole glycerol phosphate synthase subunit HisH [Haloglycomyces albus]|uniref:imidazole glycerol phosphate synthase subunit HisH n=1 Tax=Haloglycomyces albus TaxID=526067 RepID=UPI00046D5199|nr:imidazole glycerol phosphate synthase subunit HisH [Haloglycomyces albus]
MAQPHVVLFDYGSGNLRSAYRALSHAGADVELTGDLTAATAADGLVIPGVGAFAACMRGIHASGVDRVVRERAATHRPVLGICVGHQVLFQSGNEHGHVAAGIGLFDTAVERLDAPVLPHMGWNTVTGGGDLRLFDGIDPNERFYFVHSYAVKTAPHDARVARTDHGGDFIAAVESGPISATQFHPEKSGTAGLRLLGNWLSTLAE